MFAFSTSMDVSAKVTNGAPFEWKMHKMVCFYDALKFRQRRFYGCHQI